MPEPIDDPAPDPPDAGLLQSLFDTSSPFRHRMGLRRCEAEDFYAPSSRTSGIAQEKRAILNADPALYMVTSPAGTLAAREFAGLLGLRIPEDDSFQRALGLALEPDLLFVLPPRWTLEWASVCFPTRWSLVGKLHEPLVSIHAVVPDLNQELGSKIATFFERLLPGEGWRRANWGFSASTRRNQHPVLPLPSLEPELSPENLFVRVEDQHLQKLPRSGAVAFGIRIAHFRLAEVWDIPGLRPGLEEKLRTMPPSVADYKGLTALRASLVRSDSRGS